MNNLKRILRVLIWSMIMALAAAGMGMAGVIFPNHRHKRMDRQEHIEQVDEKKDEDDEDLDEIKQ